MLRNIFEYDSGPAERPLSLTTVVSSEPSAITIKRNTRRDPSRFKPGDEIYDRARVIFSRARRGSVSRASNIL